MEDQLCYIRRECRERKKTAVAEEEKEAEKWRYWQAESCLGRLQLPDVR